MFFVGTEFGLKIPMMKRLWWGAEPPQWTDPLDTPVQYVRLTHTDSSRCSNKGDCCESIRELQRYCVDELRLPDIPYNFMIGGDGIVYKGRGWYHEACRPPELDWLKNKCLDIAFVGKYQVVLPSQRLIRIALDLIYFGIQNGKIKADYKLIPIGINPKEPF